LAEKYLHIIALDVPYPADYGAMIDVYYRCRALKKAGIRIALHCFEYGRGEQPALEEVAEEVRYYKRPMRARDVLSTTPFIVRSRRSGSLLQNLLRDDHPILFEGQHTCAILDHPLLEKRRKLVRVHNIEWHYYALLAQRTANLKKRIFFQLESWKLRRFDKKLAHAEVLFCVSHQDLEHYRKLHPNVVLMPSSSPFELPEATPTRERYAIYHANLSVEENDEAARWILQAFEDHDAPMPLKIAGKNPSEALRTQAARLPFCELIANPGHAEMSELIAHAGAQLLITFQNAGIKLKLINSLVSGGVCIANPEMVNGTDLGQFCVLINTKRELASALSKLEDLYPDTSFRQRFLLENYYPDETCKRITNLL
jgi:hypothetical protein